MARSPGGASSVVASPWWHLRGGAFSVVASPGGALRGTPALVPLALLRLRIAEDPDPGDLGGCDHACPGLPWGGGSRLLRQLGPRQRSEVSVTRRVPGEKVRETGSIAFASRTLALAHRER